MTGRRNRFGRFLTGIWMISALALALTAFAHKPPAFIDYGANWASFVLPDGTLPDICLDGSGDDDTRHHHDATVACEFCRIASSIAVPLPPLHAGLPAPVLPPRAEHHPIGDIANIPVLLPAAPPQGPPSVRTTA